MVMLWSRILEKEVGSVDSFGGKLDNIPFIVCTIQDTDYVIMRMRVYGKRLPSLLV